MYITHLKNLEKYFNENTKETGMVMIRMIASEEIYYNVWIVDSGASCHMTNNLIGLQHIYKTKSRISVGNGNIE